MEFSWLYLFIFGMCFYFIIGGIITVIVLKQKTKPTRYVKNQLIRQVKLKEVLILIIASPVLLIYNFLFG